MKNQVSKANKPRHPIATWKKKTKKKKQQKNTSYNTIA